MFSPKRLSYNIQIEEFIIKQLVEIIRSICMTFHEIMCRNETKMIKKATNLSEKQFLMHPDDVLCKISVVETLY
jgi:hypothetical protein